MSDSKKASAEQEAWEKAHDQTKEVGSNYKDDLPDVYRMTVMYGGAPDPSWPYPGRPTPNTPYVPPTTDTVHLITEMPKQKVTVAARIDDKGKLWLRISVDGKHLAEVEGSKSATLTVEV